MKSITCLVLLLLLAATLVTALPFNPAEFSSKFSYLGTFSNADQHGHGHRVRRSSNRQQSFYFRSQNAAGWSLAASDCKAFLGPSATLLYIETQEELANITRFIESSDDTASLYWIGGKYDSNKGLFVWDNEVEIDFSFSPWEEGHPNTHTPATRVAFSTVGSIKYITQFNTENSRYICELKNTDDEQGDEDKSLSCKNNNDLIIILDSSGSIGKEQYKTALEFTSKLATAWVTNPQNRVSFIINSNSVHVIIPLKDSHSLSKQEIRRKIQNAPYLRARTGSNLGLDIAFRQFHQSNRSNVPQNGIFLTDGASKYTSISAEELNQAGINTFSVGIGGRVAGDELLAIAGNQTSHVFNGYPDLLGLLAPVSTRICGESKHIF